MSSFYRERATRVLSHKPRADILVRERSNFIMLG